MTLLPTPPRAGDGPDAKISGPQPHRNYVVVGELSPQAIRRAGRVYATILANRSGGDAA